MQTGRLGWLIAFTLVGLAVLIGLGVWQLDRLEWKQGVITKIEERSSGAPISLDEAIAIARKGEDPSYYRVRVEGRFDHAHERHLYAIADGKPGWHVITPLETPGGRMVLVNRGFVPEALKDPSSRPRGQIEGPVTVTGLVRRTEGPGLFTPPTILQSIAGSGPIFTPWWRRSIPAQPWSRRRFCWKPRRARCREAGPKAARPG